MPQTEEDIIRLRNGYKKESQENEEGFYIREQLITLEKQYVLQDRICVQLPEDFRDMPLELARIKYPSEQRPPVIKSNLKGDVNFTFQMLPAAVPTEHLAEFRNQMMRWIQKSQPSNVFYEQKEIHTDTINIAWFDYKSHGLDEQLYNFMYFMPIGKETLHGVFNCRLIDGKLWHPIVMKIIESIQLIKEENKNA